MFRTNNTSVSGLGKFNNWLLVASLLFMAGQVNATLINYDESTDGDLTGAQSFTVDTAGINIWTGNNLLSNGLSGNFDEFNFTLASGLMITGITFDAFNFNASGVSLLTDGRNLSSGGVNLWNHKQRFNSIDTEIFLVPLPYSSGSFSVDNFLSLNPTGSVWSIDWDWQIQLTVSPASVPEPTTLALLSLSLFGFGFNKRKRL